ncbi:MAG TPA: AzlC family ABC transporter permease [Oscillospiraceae bacterium]|nr:AzlC family ABC transporter permease [Oscillospiraceae bacterium]
MKSFRFALIQVTPLLFSYLFVGLAAGLLLHAAGYGVLWAFFSALFVYAGSMQIVMVSLLASGAPLPVVAAMAFFINARHMFYGIGFVDRFRAVGGWRYPYMALTMTDETYSVLCSVQYPPDVDGNKADFYIQLLCHLFWVFSCTTSALIGSLLPVDLSGIEFSATAFFVTVVVNQWRGCGSHIPAVTGFASAAVFYFLIGPDNFILPALSASLVALVFLRERVAGEKKRGAPHA